MTTTVLVLGFKLKLDADLKLGEMKRGSCTELRILSACSQSQSHAAGFYVCLPSHFCRFQVCLRLLRPFRPNLSFSCTWTIIRAVSAFWNFGRRTKRCFLGCMPWQGKYFVRQRPLSEWKDCSALPVTYWVIEEPILLTAILTSYYLDTWISIFVIMFPGREKL